MTGLKGRRTGGDAWYAPNGIGTGYVPYVSGGKVLWLPPGTAGKVLTANGAAAPSWEDSAEIPPGGATGQILTKQSAADFDADWEDPGGSGAGTGSTLTYTTNLAFYYKASNATKTGSRITALNDAAGSGVNLAQATTADQPHYVPNAINGQPTMAFHGAAGLAAASVPLSAANNYTVFCVVRIFGYIDTTSRFLWYNGNTGSNGYGPYAKATALRLLHGGVLDIDLTSLFPPSVPLIHCLERSSGTSTQYFNGAAWGGTSGSTPGTPSGAFAIGKSFIGEVAEVIGFNAALNSTDRGTVFADLGTAYNIPVE